MANQYHLNDEQRAAVEHGDGPLLIIAGAGTGKTTVITQRVKHLILDKEILPSEILALTFTEKAALEMETRIDEMLPYGYTQLWVQTFHAFCDRILRQEAIHIGLNPAYTLATEAEATLFLRKHLYELKLDYFRPLGNPYKFLQAMLTHFARLADDDITPEQYLLYAQEIRNPIRQLADEIRKNSKKLGARRSALDAEVTDDDIRKTVELANAFKVYEELKAKEGIMDFSNLIANVLKLFRTRKNILRYYQEKFKYILVDEFQDTNFAQNELAILLAGDDKNITVVGDDDQSIYRWRGAAIANMLQFKSHFPKAKIITLTKNYRSTKEILQSAYVMIQNNNPDRLEVKEKIDKKLSSHRNIEGQPIELLFGNRVEDEAELVIKKIKEETKNNDRKWNDFAILVRANDHALPFQRSLERARIPYQFLGPGHLFRQEEIKDLIAYLRILANFDDQAALYRVLTMPIFNLEARDIAAILNSGKKRNKTLFETLEEPDSISVSESCKEKIRRLVEMIKRHLALVPRENAGQILYHFFEESGLLGHYLDPRSLRTERQAQNVAKFFDKLQSYAAAHDDASVFAVVDWIELASELGESPLAAEMDWSDTDAVNILTVHSSKGLEFPVVFVVNLVTQRFPSRDRKEPIPVPQDLIKEELPEGDENLQEERRLFYVAMTRARDKLFLSAANYYGEGKRERKISPFVYEALGEKYVDSVIKKQRLENSVQQLSLLEILAPTAENASPTTPISLISPIAQIPPITYLSYSQLQTFDLCPLHYKLRYIMKLPTAPSAALSFGTTMHALLKTIYQLGFGKKALPDDVIDKLIDEYWVGNGYAGKAHEEDAKKGARNLLLSYMQQNAREPHLPIQTEMPFQFMLDKIKILGRFDRIDQLDDNRIEIIDYKTGINVPDDKKIKSDLQLTLYALAATQINDPLFRKKPDEITLTLYYIEPNIRMSTTRTQEQLDKAKELILRKVEEIQQSAFRCSGIMLCKDCEYAMLCSTYSN